MKLLTVITFLLVAIAAVVYLNGKNNERQKDDSQARRELRMYERYEACSGYEQAKHKESWPAFCAKKK